MGRRANGEAKPYLNERTGRYEVFLELPAGEDGKRRRKKVTGRNVTEVRDKAKQVRADVDRLGAVANTSITISKMMSDFLELNPGNITAGSLETYTRTNKLYITPRIGRKRVAQLQPRDVTVWLKGLEADGLSPSTRRLARSLPEAGARLGGA